MHTHLTTFTLIDLQHATDKLPYFDPQCHDAKMTGALTVGAEVHALFRTKRVSEIRQVEARVRSEAEDKAEALRDLLGTRYKDLLKAADRVVAVRDASKERVTDALTRLAKDSTALREHFNGQAADTSAGAAHSDDVTRRRREQVVAAKLKHIVDSTEELYAHLEHGRLYDAAARLAAAQRNYAALEEHGGHVARFAGAQWRGVSAFRPQIYDAASVELVADGKLVDEYAKVAAALIIAPVDESLRTADVLRRFLAARATAIRKELTASSGAMDARMREVAMLVKSTVASVAQMMHPETGIVHELVRAADDEAANVVRDDVSGTKLHGICVPWLDDVRQILESDGRMLLDGVNTSRELATALMDVDDILVDEEWAEPCSTALGVDPRAVFAVFAPVISERANVVSKESVEHVAESVDKSLQQEWANIKSAADTGKHVWSAVTEQSLYEANSTEIEGRDDAGSMTKLLSASGPASRVEATLVKTMTTALSDAKYICERVPSVSNTFNQAVIETAPKIVDSLAKRNETLVKNASETMMNEENEQCAERALLVARIASVLLASEVVEQAFHFEQVMKLDAGEQLQSGEYERFCASLEDVSQDAYTIWANQKCAALGDKLRADLDTVVDSFFGSEEDDVRQPKTASVAAVGFAVAACKVAGEAGGAALPRRASNALTAEMCRVLVAVYTPLSQRGAAVSDAALMQASFDLRWLCAVFANGDALRAVRSQIESAIDPVDLAHCKRGIAEDVDAFHARTATLLGALGGGRPADAVVPSGEAANTIAMAQPVERFTYLPAPMPSTYSLGSGLSARAAVELLKKETRTKTPTAATAAAAAAKKHDLDSAVADYATKVTDTMGRLGSRFLGSFMG